MSLGDRHAHGREAVMIMVISEQRKQEEFMLSGKIAVLGPPFGGHCQILL